MNLCMAHRGWSGKAPENTMAAIYLALQEAQIKGIEIDVQLSRDGVPVVIHDFQLGRTANGKGYVKDYTFEELSQFDVGTWFSPEFSGEKIPTLEEVLQAVKGKCILNIEIKAAGDLYPGIEKKVVELVCKYSMGSEVYITSFDHKVIRKIKEMNTDIKTGLIVWGKPLLIEEQLRESGATILSMGYPYLTSQFVSDMIGKGISIIAWTVDDVEDIQFVTELHPEIQICTNHPEKMLR